MRPVHNSVTSCDTDFSPTSQNLVSLILGKVPQTPVIPTAQCHDLEFRDLNSGIPELREALFITGRERQESLRDHLSVQPFLSVYLLPRQRTVSSPSGKTEGEGGELPSATWQNRRQIEAVPTAMSVTPSAPGRLRKELDPGS